MTKKKTVCLDDSQIERLVTDTTKLAKGIDEDICPTVREIVEEKVPKELRVSKAHKKKNNEGESVVERYIGKKIGERIGGRIERALDGFF